MAMADSDYNSHGARLYILNGQPLLIRDNSNINTVNSISADILQQALQDAGTSVNDSLTVLDDSNFLASKQSVNGRSIDKNEYVAILGGEEDTEESSIHLTLEQAAELGLQFESEDQSFDATTRRSGTKQKQFIFSADSHENETLFQREVNHTQPHTDIGRDKVDSSGNYGTSIGIITSQGQNDASVNQQVVFIPQIINGTVAYAVQMAGEQNEFVQDSFPATTTGQNNIKTTTVLAGGNNFNLTGLTSSSVLSLIQPTLTAPQVSMMSSDNRIEPLLNGNNQNASNLNHHTDSAEKLTTYILPSSLHVNSSNNTVVSKSTSSSVVSYEHTTSLQQIPDPVRKQKLLNNGVTKQRSVLKSLQPSLVKELNKVDVSVDLVEPQRASRLIINGMPELKQFSQPAEEMAPKSKEEAIKDNSKDILFDKRRSSTEDKITAATSDINKEITLQLTTCTDEGKLTATPTLITPEDGSVPQDVSAALNRASIKADAKKPLGSNENPIQLVQRGQIFHSVQALTQEQLKRVMTVLKQEHLDTGKSSKNVLFDAESNTRIIYRVVCPEELYLQKKEDENAPKRRGRRKKNQQPSGPPNNNANNNDGSNGGSVNNTGGNNTNNAEAEDEATPRRKQVFPRTRSGRLSRPPKHMVRDYKRIRKMDVDDSDGAYSDYHSDHDEENVTPANNLLPGLSAKQKHNITTNFRCPTCGKIYLGLVRMAQHFDKYPDHGSAEYLKTLQNAHTETEAGTAEVRTVVGGTGNGIWRNGRIGGRKRGRGRGGSYITSLTTSSHKCHRLRETLDACDEQEIVKIAGPVVASVLTAWDLLLLRIDAVREESKVAALYQELKQLLHKIRLISSKLFKPLDHQFNSGTAAATGDAFTVDIDDDLMSYVLELPCGMYFGSDVELCSPDYQIVAQKRPKKETEPDDIAVVDDAPKAKRQKLDCKETVAPHEEILSSLAVVTKSQESNLNSEEKLENSDSNVSQPSFLLTGEEMMCDSEDRGGLDSVDEIVSERLQNLTDSNHQSQSEMLKSDVDELMKGFAVNILDHRVVGSETGQNQSDLEPPDDLIDGFSSISSQRPHVSASTEDLIKSLEHFGSELNQPEDRTPYPSSSIDRENFSRMPNVDTLDFEVLSREFHSNNR